jgi:hypothetical protein
MASFMLSHFSYVLFVWLLSWGSVDVPMLMVEVTWAQETAAAAEALPRRDVCLGGCCDTG